MLKWHARDGKDPTVFYSLSADDEPLCTVKIREVDGRSEVEIVVDRTRLKAHVTPEEATFSGSFKAPPKNDWR